MVHSLDRKTVVLLASVILAGVLNVIVAFATTGGEGETPQTEATKDEPLHPDNQPDALTLHPMPPHLTQQIYRQGTHDEQPIMRPDGSILVLRKGPRNLQKLLDMPPWLHLGIQHRTRYESYNEPFRKNETGGAQQIPLRTLVQLGIRFDPIRFFAEFMDVRALATTGVAITNRMEDEHDLLQLYAGLGTHNFLGLGVPTEFTVGRFTMDFGRRRLIARNHFGNAPNSFSGFHWALGDATWNFRAFLVRPVLRFPTTPDKEDANTLFWGGSLAQQRLPWLHTELYAFVLQENELVKGSEGVLHEDTTHGQRENLNTIGVRLFKPKAVRTFDYEIESDWQFGKSSLQAGSPILTTFAHYQHAEVGYTFPLPWNPHLLVQYDYASGDKDPTDNHNGRFDTLFGVVNFEFNRSGIWQPFNRSNVSSPGYRLTFTPRKEITFYVGHRLWWLAQSRDQWVGTGLQDPTGRAGNYLGHQIETSLHWVVGPNLQFETGWNYLVKGSFIQNLRDQRVAGTPTDNNVSYTYFQTVLTF